MLNIFDLTHLVLAKVASWYYKKTTLKSLELPLNTLATLGVLFSFSSVPTESETTYTNVVDPGLPK